MDNSIYESDIRPLETHDVSSVTPKPKRQLKYPKMITSIIGMLSGVLSIILGFCMHCGGYYYTSLEKYGGDAYTGIQNAAAETSRNVYGLGQCVESGFKFLLIVVGIIAICYFTFKLFDTIEGYKKSVTTNQPTTTNAPQASSVDEIKKLKDLLDMNAITQEEFDTKKKQILGL